MSNSEIEAILASIEEQLKRIADFLIATSFTPASVAVEKFKKNAPVVSEELTGTVGMTSEKAVQLWLGRQYAWIPKKAIENLNEIVLKTDDQVTVKLAAWFQGKVEWRDAK